MKQASKNHPFDSMDECLNNAVKQGVFHLYTQDDYLDGRIIKINNNNVVNFGSCSYLGLEVDDRLKQGAINATLKYGTQFSSSRAYISCGLYEELENQLSEIFGGHAIVAQSSSLVHIATIPVIIDDNDAIILDHQVHGSVQNAVQLTRTRGVTVDIIRHSNLEMLEDKIKSLSTTHYRIWYMVDGVYSMYGDYAPIKELYELMDKYPQLHLYVDDAHGMSWTGKNGSGYILSQVQLHPKMILTTSLAKGFGTGGGVVVFTDLEIMRRVRTCGASFLFSGPIQPPMLGATIESAKIHLSPEIYELQQKLKSKIEFCDQLIQQKKLPYTLPSGSPIFYLALGLPRMGYNMINRLINDGFYSDIGIFPGVPLKRTGIRLPINNSHTLTDIENVINAISHHYPYVLEDEKQTITDIGKHFRMNFSYASHLNPKESNYKTSLTLNTYTTIEEINEDVWDNLLGNRGSFDWQGCKFLEGVFSKNDEPENNWDFYYFTITDENNKIILATFFSHLLCKDDMLSPSSVSEQIEKIRKNNPYYLTSKIMMMGSLLTEGDHLYIDRTNPKWKQAIIKLMDQVREIQEKHQANAIYLRDIDSDDLELRDFFINQGFIRVDMPDSYKIEKPSWDNTESFLDGLSSKSRTYQRKEVLPFEQYYDINIIKNASEQEIEYWKILYHNIKQNKLKFNTFDLPLKIFQKIVTHKNWIILELKLKKEYQKENTSSPLSVGFIYKSKQNICPIFMGIDYQYLDKYHPYRQNLYQTIKLGRSLNVENVFLGMEAGMEKSRFGAIATKKSNYIQFNESFNLEELNIFSNTK